MERKNVVIIALCVAIAVMAIAYAAFSTTLTVNGTVQSTGNFSVTYQSGGTCTGTKAGQDTPTGTIGITPGTTTATLNVSLYTPGDIVTCTIPVKNTGNIVAKLEGDSVVSNGLNKTTEPVSVEVTDFKYYDPDSGVTYSNEFLDPGVTKNMTVIVKYNWSGEQQPSSSDLTKTFTVTSNFVQVINY